MTDDVLLDNAPDATEILVVRVERWAPWLETVPPATADWLKRTVVKPEPGASLWLPADGSAKPRVLAIAGKDSLAALGDLAHRLPEGDYALVPDGNVGAVELEHWVLGFALGAYRFQTFKTSDRKPARLVVPASLTAASLRERMRAIALVRDLVNMPATDMMPEHLDAAAKALAMELGAEHRSIVGDALLSERFPTIHAVGRASTSAPRLIELGWGNPANPELVLIGKGVCFDSGGLDIKSADGMRHMKKDMGGAAHVLGIARLVMAECLPVRLRVLIPAVENAISGNAFRPGDIIRTRKGLTVEVDNTDAEGRLVLCDAIALACERKPALIIDFATLTGAARSALGTDLPAMFCNDDNVAEDVLAAASRVADPVWRMPLHQPYRKMLDSRAADMVNSGRSPYAGAITAALFLESFVASGVPWVHFDLMAWNVSATPGRPEGGEAMGLRTIHAYLCDRFAR